ncbi:LuxR family maltose regulon positive regulatory protein [Paraburkholderia bannensis]|uniref:LuxR family maltose regulon positive regulatory protein n=1 Tax=Paraburkholderia bannensis TaxID=765414 RepID=A0A7W9WT20_9BURK|nr:MULTISPECIES: LuxR C-terminal-related transcriptional regulator [Paraburkholderia]MBB3258096.1 LuxR family maltose regulon positive regulatory protein [Paraburkholderia sp. WP4_3_2]MBB6103109.1 LuxR family maltose regulon positive regulatory protein [Paraburkholderia bannensis]
MNPRPERRRRDAPADHAAGAAALAAALIHTRLAPAHAREHVARVAPIERLRAGLDRKLTVVCAPAGYGKSTVLAEWRTALLAQGAQAAWVSFDDEDDEPSVFAAYVIAAVMEATGGVGLRAQQQLRERAVLPIHVAFAELLNELAASSTPLFLFLDDIDRLEAPAIHEALFSLLRYAPDHLHLVLGCRSTPALPLSYFASRDQLVWLDADTLRFSRTEAAEFVRRVAGKELGSADLEALVGATEGWVSGLQLAALALRDDADAAQVVRRVARARGGIAAYLNENVTHALPQPVRDFLLATAILDRMTPALCNALTGRDDAHAMLEWLSARNLFVKTLDGETQWFRYHALFSHYLREELLVRKPQTVPDLHRAAARWLGAAGLWPEAVRHALAAGEVGQAADWVESCAMELIAASDVRTVLNWIARLPDSAFEGRVRLRLAHAWALALSLQIVAARRALERIEADIDNGALAIDDVAALDVLAVRSLVAGLADDSAESLRLGRQVLDAQPSAGSWVEQIGQTTLIFGLSYAGGLEEMLRLRARDEASEHEPLYSNVYRRSMSGLGEFVAGRLHDASNTFEAALRIAEERAGRLCAAAALPAGYLGAICYEWGDLARVRELQRERLPIALQACSLGPMLRFALTAAMDLAHTGDFSGAYALLRDVERVAAGRQWLRLQVACLGAQVRIGLMAGNLTHAHRHGDALRALSDFDGQPPPAAGSAIETWAFAQTARARLLMSDGHAREAADAFGAVHRELAARGVPWFAAQAAVPGALARHAAGHEEAALALLADALAYGQRNGLVRSFVDEGEGVVTLLSAIAQTPARFADVSPWYLDELKSAFAGAAAGARSNRQKVAARPAASLAANNLSAREVEILDYVARGLSNKEIARALRVAPETIKWHLKNIFEKLNVNSRIQAVRSGLAFDMPSVGRETRAPGEDTAR